MSKDQQAGDPQDPGDPPAPPNLPVAAPKAAAAKGAVKPSAYCALAADGQHKTPIMPGHIYFFVRSEHQGPIPKEQEDARQELEGFSRVLRIVFLSGYKNLFDEHFNRLLVIAQGAFTPHGFRPEPLNDFDSFKEEIVRTAGGKVKSNYLLRMAIGCAIAAVAVLVLSTCGHFIERHALTQGWVSPDSVGLRASILNTGFLLTASMLGLFFASCIRNMEFTFDTLVTPDADLASPWVRVVFFGIAVFIMALLFQSKVVTVAIGNVSTAAIADSALTAVVVGLLLGVAERAVPKEVIRWSGKFFKSAQPK